MKQKYQDLILKNIRCKFCQKKIHFIKDRICEYNESNVPFDSLITSSEINRYIQDDKGNIIAGINCIYYAWKCIYVDALWVKEEFRHAVFGSELLGEIEKISKDYGCHIVHLDTFDFRAEDFYIKQGYDIHGVLDDCPQGHKRYYIKKILEIRK